MSTATDNLQAAQRRAMAIRPAVGGFPVLAETLHRAGVRRNIWSLPSAAESLPHRRRPCHRPTRAAGDRRG